MSAVDAAETKVEKWQTRYNGRVKKRQWEEGQEKCEKDEAFVRIKKRKVAMLLAYSGADYNGMQRNPDVKTIEGDLHKALLDANLISQESYDQIQTVNFQRAARTDKGVSAARQIVSVKLPEELDISVINEKLPPFIRVLDYKRVTKGFDAKQKCDARTYIYVLPSYAFENQDVEIVDYINYRVSQEKIQQLNEFLKKFIGTHNFHNFTSKKHFVDPSANRFIVNFECGKPFVQENMEFCVITIKGQSFMLHQIRKMVGLSLAVLRGVTTADILEKAFLSDRYDLPMAPGLGLVLDQVHYERYDDRYGNDGVHESLTWDNVEDKVDEFKTNFIFPTIVGTEIKDMPMAEWLKTLPLHSYSVRTEELPQNGEKSENNDEEVENLDDKPPESNEKSECNNAK